MILTVDTDTVVRQYLATAEWAESNDEIDYRDYKFHPYAIERAQEDVGIFLTVAAHEIANLNWVTQRNWEQDFGHDLWLTRNHHGAGFWDGDWPKPYGEIFDRTVKKFFTPIELEIGDDGFIYNFGGEVSSYHANPYVDADVVCMRCAATSHTDDEGDKLIEQSQTCYWNGHTFVDYTVHTDFHTI